LPLFRIDRGFPVHPDKEGAVSDEERLAELEGTAEPLNIANDVIK